MLPELAPVKFTLTPEVAAPETVPDMLWVGAGAAVPPHPAAMRTSEPTDAATAKNVFVDAT